MTWFKVRKSKLSANAWTEKDIRLMLELAGTMSKQDLAKKLGIKLSRLESKAHYQGISLVYKMEQQKND